MTAALLSLHTRRQRLAGLGVLAVAVTVAAVSARPYAGGWNDGSRLATVECLVDHRTLVIDDSIFVRVPVEPIPYPRHEPGLLQNGTGDKLFINGHFYSDKSPVPALLLAALYHSVQTCTGLVARERPDLFCYLMTLASSGLAYVVSVWCVFRLGALSRLSFSIQIAVTASFAWSTVALTYSRHVNNHILLLGVTALLLLGLVRLASDQAGSVWHCIAIGTLAGLGYTIDLGAGPILLICALVLVAYRCRRILPVACFCVAALPWLALHHAVNYVVGSTFKPANAVPDYLLWPGSSFGPQNMTGALNHSIAHFGSYAAQLLVGKRGFLGHNLPLFLAVPGFLLLLRRRFAERPEVVFAGLWCGGAWLAYAVTSNNYSGLCCSIRWFLPFLAPGYYVLGLLLREYPRYHGDFLLLSAWGVVLSAVMWWHGPWIKHMVPGFWPIFAGTLVSWLAYRIRQRRKGHQVESASEPLERMPRAA